MYRPLLLTASLLGALGVALGAMGAHFLKEKISPEGLQAFETGVRYQMYHALAALLLVALGSRCDERMAKIAGRLFIAGIILFSGSVYILSCKSLMGFGPEQLHWLGPVTPLGGVAFIAGWLCLFTGIYKQKA